MGSTTQLFDVLIVGGGPAGLSTALALARQLYTAVVFDSGVYRNDRAHHMHNVLTWDHHEPTEFRKTARENIVSRYKTIQLQDIAVTSVQKSTNNVFQAVDSNGNTWLGRKLVLATGVQDISPDIDGYADCWGDGIFHCLFCHGFEERGSSSAGVLAVGDCASVGPATHLSHMTKRLASSVTVYTNASEELSKSLSSALENAGLELDSRPISRLHRVSEGTEVEIEFEDGSKKTEGFLVHKPKTQVNGPFAQQLSLELTDEGDIQTKNPFYETSLPGVFALGDCGSPGKAVAQAMATALWGSSGLVSQLQTEPVPEL